MKNQITIREAITEADIAVFWGQLHTYHMRDIFPDSENENRKHFLDDTEYRAQIQRVHDRQQDRCYYLFFHRDGQDIGFGVLHFPGVPRRRNRPNLRRCTSKLGKDARRALCGAELRRG